MYGGLEKGQEEIETTYSDEPYGVALISVTDVLCEDQNGPSEIDELEEDEEEKVEEIELSLLMVH